MIFRWRSRARKRPEPVPRDIEGVVRAEAELEHSTRQLQHDKAATINPLRHEAYRNNIQQLVVALLRPQPGPGDRQEHGPSASAR